MRCNLSCAGCFAAEYPPDKDLEPEILQKVVDEGNEMGVHLFTLLGGEPFIYDGLLDLAASNQQSYFQIFTNGTLIDEEIVDELAELGNVAPMLSLEGDEETTDARRGRGVYRQILEVMDMLGDRGIVFGYSATVTRDNWRMLISDEWVDPLVARGAVLNWNFLYMPIGRDPSTAPMLTPDERNEFREGVLRIRDTKPIFAGRLLGRRAVRQGVHRRQALHARQQRGLGRAVHLHPLRDRQHPRHEPRRRVQLAVLPRDPPPAALQSQPAQALHAHRQPGAVARDHGAHRARSRRTRGAESLFTELRADIDDYAAEVERVYAPVWSCTVGQEAERGVGAAAR